MLVQRFFTLITFFISAIHISAQCDISKRPIVFVHGFLASGDTYAKQIQRFIDHGYCQNRLFVFDWNSVSSSGKKTDSLLNAFIDGVIKSTGVSQLDLVGHSAGGGLGRGYLIDSVNANKIAHYIHLGSRKWSYEYSWFPNSKCLNIYSSADRVMGKMSGEVEGAVNLDLKDKDHYEVATSMETFHAMYDFLNNGKKVSNTKSNSSECFVSGKAVLLGDNVPMKKSKIAVYRINDKNGKRLSKEPEVIFITDDRGGWGTFAADRKSNYELELKPSDTTQRTISYFFGPFNETNNYVYLRGFPKGNMIANMLGNLPSKNDQSLIIIYSSQKAVIAGRDSLTINNISLSSPELAPASKTVISTFVFDDGDGKTSGNSLKQFGVAPFLNGVDIFLPAGKNKSHSIFYNGKKLTLPAKNSNERIMLALF